MSVRARVTVEPGSRLTVLAAADEHIAELLIVRHRASGWVRKRRAPEYVPYRMLEVESAANAVYAWAAEQILACRLPKSNQQTRGDYASAVRHEAQVLRHRAHHKLMQAFLEPEIFEGAITLAHARRSASSRQLQLVEGPGG